MPSFRDRSGEKVGRLTILCEAADRIGGRITWHCRCDCGNEIVRPGRDLYLGRTNSCGCLLSEAITTTNISRTKHGHAKSAGGNARLVTPTYKSFLSMRQRCLNPNSPNYHRYGGRGISICDRWQGEKGFQNFLSDIGERPRGSSLDRIDTDGDYTPDNCRWATAKEQSNNRRNTNALAAARHENLKRGRKYWPRKP